MLISYLKRDSDYGDSVDRTTILRGGTEADLSGGIDGILIESVAEPANDAQDSETSGRREEDLEHDIAFEAGPASFLGIVGTGLEQNFERLGHRLTFGSGLPHGIGRHGGWECRRSGFGLKRRLCWRNRGSDSTEAFRRCDSGDAAVRVRSVYARGAESRREYGSCWRSVPGSAGGHSTESIAYDLRFGCGLGRGGGNGAKRSRPCSHGMRR